MEMNFFLTLRSKYLDAVNQGVSLLPFPFSNMFCLYGMLVIVNSQVAGVRRHKSNKRKYNPYKQRHCKIQSIQTEAL